MLDRACIPRALVDRRLCGAANQADSHTDRRGPLARGETDRSAGSRRRGTHRPDPRNDPRQRSRRHAAPPAAWGTPRCPRQPARRPPRRPRPGRESGRLRQRHPAQCRGSRRQPQLQDGQLPQPHAALRAGEPGHRRAHRALPARRRRQSPPAAELRRPRWPRRRPGALHGDRRQPACPKAGGPTRLARLLCRLGARPPDRDRGAPRRASRLTSDELWRRYGEMLLVAVARR